MNEYGGHWITTYTGKQFHFLDPQPEEIDIVDIAHALSLTCRFGGQCKEFYSVAEHCIRVAEITPQEYKLPALLHDAEEAYMLDLPRPIKYNMPEEWWRIKTRIVHAIFDTLKIPKIGGSPIKEADNILLATEARDLMANTKDWAPLPKPLEETIKPFASSEFVEELFLLRFEGYKNALCL